MTHREEKRIPRRTSFKEFYIRQFVSLLWMLLAVGIGLSLRQNIAWLKEAVDPAAMALVSGLIGIVIPNVTQFGRAGRVLTKTDDARTNLLVGAGVTLLALLLFNWVLSLWVN